MVLEDHLQPQMGHLQRVELIHVKTIRMANTREVAHSSNKWCMANARDDHEMSDLTRFLMKIFAGTTPAPKASNEPLTRHKILDACKTAYTDGT